jgi:hypothetical protein
LQALYRKVFEAYLAEKLDLLSYELLFHNEEVPMTPVPKGRQNYYQYCSTLPMEYLYLRNNLCIERLEEKDLALLQQCHEAGQYEVTEELTEMVVRTYIRVIRVFDEADSFGHEPDNMITTYYPYGGGLKHADNQAVVFEIRKNRNYTLYTNEELHAQAIYLDKEIFPLMREDFKAKMGEVEIEIFSQTT